MSAQSEGTPACGILLRDRARVTEVLAHYAAARFSYGRPRSSEYQQGFMAALVRVDVSFPDSPDANPHARPSAAADAWDSGHAEAVLRRGHFASLLNRAIARDSQGAA